MVDYREDMRFSDEMIKRVAEAYRKIRNTLRYLLSNLYDFDPARTRWRRRPRRARPLRPGPAPAGRGARAARPTTPTSSTWSTTSSSSTARWTSRPSTSTCSRTGSTATPRDGPRRRSVADRAAPDRGGPDAADGARAALHRGRGLAAPPRRRADSVHVALFPDGEAADDLRARALGARCSTSRAAVTRPWRRRARPSASPPSLEARSTITGPAGGPRAAARLRGEEPRLPRQPGQPVHRERGRPGGGRGASRSRSSAPPGSKCERCWTYPPNVGTPGVHPGVCERCAAVLEAR